MLFKFFPGRIVPVATSFLPPNLFTSHTFSRSSLRDCEFALKHKPDYDKATIRAANCCFEISSFDKCIEYCDGLLSRQPELEEAARLRQRAVSSKKVKERDERARKAAERRERERDDALLDELKKRGIKTDGNSELAGAELFNSNFFEGGLSLELLEPKFPQLARSRVHLDGAALVWPVVLMFPEYKLTEFVQSCSENDSVNGILEMIFDERPDWDVERKYDPGSVGVYYEDRKNGKVHSVAASDTLKTVLGKES